MRLKGMEKGRDGKRRLNEIAGKRKSHLGNWLVI